MTKKQEKSLYQWVTERKYLIALVLFGIWMLFFDKYDVFTQMSLSKTANELIEEKEMYIGEIQKTKQEIKWVESNSEKFARENYYLSKPQEDVFIFVEE